MVHRYRDGKFTLVRDRYRDQDSLFPIVPVLFPVHRCDSIQGTDYIANPFFLIIKVSRTTIENLR